MYTLILLMVLNASAQSTNELKELAVEVALDHSLEPTLFLAIIEQESSWKVNAHNKLTGDYGLGQINERNVASLNLDKHKLLTDPRYNLEVSALILKQLKARYGHEYLYWARYNCGTRKIAPELRPTCLKYVNLVNKRMKQQTIARELLND